MNVNRLRNQFLVNEAWALKNNNKKVMIIIIIMVIPATRG